MRKIKTKFVVVLAFGGLLAGMVLYGCKSDQSPSAQGVTTQPASFALFGPPPQKTGVELWSENCMRCHNGRPPEEFSAAQWDVIVHHMRLRANLTGVEAREIVKFLQASN
ncbi:MAG: cytochrome c [Tepidisphaeraceae bacterium]